MLQRYSFRSSTILNTAILSIHIAKPNRRQSKSHVHVTVGIPLKCICDCNCVADSVTIGNRNSVSKVFDTLMSTSLAFAIVTHLLL